MTDEKLDALVFALDHDHPDDIDYRECSTAITTLRAQLAAQQDDVAALVEALRCSCEGWASVLALGLLPEVHRPAANLFHEGARAALARVKSKGGFSDEKGVM
jgi:hypothetical protein